MFDSVWPQRQQPTSLPHPWDSPGTNTGVGYHFLPQSMKVKSESEVVQSCPTLRDPMDCSLPGSSIQGIFQARVLEWGAITFSKVLGPLQNQKKNHRVLSSPPVLWIPSSWPKPPQLANSQTRGGSGPFSPPITKFWISGTYFSGDCQ